MKSYTDFEQSKILAEILPIESADMAYLKIPNSSAQGFNYSDYPYHAHLIAQREHKLPCWSLAALLELIPNTLLSRNDDGLWGCKSVGNPIVHSGWFYDPVNACYEMIIKLHEQKLL